MKNSLKQNMTREINETLVITKRFIRKLVIFRKIYKMKD